MSTAARGHANYDQHMIGGWQISNDTQMDYGCPYLRGPYIETGVRLWSFGLRTTLYPTWGWGLIARISWNMEMNRLNRGLVCETMHIIMNRYRLGTDITG